MPNETDYALNEKLISAVEGNDIEQVKRLIAEGADVNCKRGNVPLLIYAIFRSKWVSVNTLRCLLENGAKVDELDDISSTALSWAVYQARPEAVALLLEFNSEPRRLSKDGVSSLQVIEGYLSDYTGPASENPYRLSRLEIMIGYTDPAEAVAKWIECKELLIQRIEELEKEEAKLLKRERRSDNEDEQLIKNAKLFNAIRKNELPSDERSKKVKKALERGANVNAQDANDENNSPLHLAVKKGQEETVVFLLQRGENVELKNNKEETPLDLAKNNPGVLKLLTEHVGSADMEVAQPVINIDQPGTSMAQPKSEQVNKADNLESGRHTPVSPESEVVTLKLDLDVPNWQVHWEQALKVNPSFKVLEISIQKLSKAIELLPSVFQQSLGKAHALFFLTVKVKEQDTVLEPAKLQSLVESTIKGRPLITEWELPSGNQVYIKEAKSDVFTASDLKATSRFHSGEAFEEGITSGEHRFNFRLLFDALILKKGGQFKSVNHPSLLATTFDQEEGKKKATEFDGWNLLDYAVKDADSLSVQFLLLSPWNLAEQNSIKNRALEIAAEYADIHTFKALLGLPSYESDVNFRFLLTEEKRALLDLKDEYGNNPLRIMAKSGQKEILQFLIELGVDLEDKNPTTQQSAIDLAWENKRYDCVGMLLEADMAFPKTFNVGELVGEAKALVRLKQLVDERSQLHQLAQTGDVAGIKRILKSSVFRGQYGLNAEKQSVLFTALKAKQYEVYVELRAAHFFLLPEEEHYFNDLGMHEREALRPFLEAKSLEPEDSYLTYLSNKSQLGWDNTRDQFKFVNEFYGTLNKIPQLKAVMQVLAKSETMKIYFDFNKEHILDIDPTSCSSSEKGRYEPKYGGRLYMSAKGANVEGESVMKGEVLGTLAHEMTHFAMQLRYNNNPLV